MSIAFMSFRGAPARTAHEAVSAPTPAQEEPATESVRLALEVAESREIVLGADDPVLSSHGPARHLALAPEVGGRLFLWVLSDEVDPLLRAVRRGAAPLEDDSSGGGSTPWIACDVRPGEAIEVAIAASRAGTAGMVELHALLVTASDERRAGSEAVRTEIAFIAQDKAVDPDTTRAALTAWIEDEIERGSDGACALGLDVELARASSLALELGELPAAEQGALAALERLSSVRPADHPALRAARRTAGITRLQRGDLAGAKPLFVENLASAERALPADDPDLQRARMDVASVLAESGDFAAAIEVEEKIVATYARTVPDDDPVALAARTNLALDLVEVGELRRARALQEGVLAGQQRLHPAGHAEVAGAYLNLGITLAALGEEEPARAHKEAALAMYARFLPDDHPYVLQALQSCANARRSYGDASGARALLERVVSVLARTLPDDHARLLVAREALALAARDTGELAQARDLLEGILEVRSRTLPEGHRDLQRGRRNLCNVQLLLGATDRALELAEKELEVHRRALPEDHPDVIGANMSLAVALKDLGEIDAARGIEEELLPILQGDVDPLLLRQLRNNLATTRARLGDQEGAAALALELARELRATLGREQLVAAPTEVETRAGGLRQYLATILSLSRTLAGSPRSQELEREAFATLEAMRSATLEAARGSRSATGPEVERLAAEARAASAELVRFAREGAGVDELLDARLALERIERELRSARVTARGASAPRAALHDPEALQRALAPDEAWVSFARYERTILAPESARDDRVVSEFSAFVVRPEKELARIDLGPAEVLEDLVEAWRRAVLGEGVAAPARGIAGSEPSNASEEASGRALVDAVVRPLLPLLEGVRVLELAPDDVLHLVPFDALPLETGLVRERFEVFLRANVREVLEPDPPRTGGAGLLVLGGADYDGDPADRSDEDRSKLRARVDRRSSIGRPGSFSPLPATLREAEEIAELWNQVRGGDTRPCIGGDASYATLLAEGPSARFLHLATHGWFLPSATATPAGDPGAGAPGGWLRQSLEAQITAGSPLLLCGLALAGANLALGASALPGTITAEELARQDLSSCELAVLSACDTNVGVRRAGQGVASLQKALHLAGARTVITSLWKVPDEATRALMVAFYRGIWLDGKTKSVALWEAKQALRDVRDENGRARHSIRDWGAWVLTGDPR